MHVYLARHGRANAVETDSQQSLSDEGRAEMLQIAEFLMRQRRSVFLIQHSGILRAEQTAHIFAEHLRATAGPSHAEGLAPNDDPWIMANFLKCYDEDVLLVGHLPHLERLTSVLLTGNPDRRPVRLEHGGVVCLEKGHDGTWCISWALVPELLQAA